VLIFVGLNPQPLGGRDKVLFDLGFRREGANSYIHNCSRFAKTKGNMNKNWNSVSMSNSLPALLFAKRAENL
jgi:hypothetical protein